MAIGVVLHRSDQTENLVDDFVTQARQAYDAGVRQVWVAQQFDHDAITLAAVIGASVPGLGVGTYVVPINPRHPLVVASQAQTAQAATHGNFSLGLGLGAHAPEERAFGTPWPNTIARLREHLRVLRSIIDTGAVDFHGDVLSAAPEWPVAVPGGTPLPVYVAAMGPKALRVTGELADGTLPFLAGPRALSEFIVPTIVEAAERVGRPAPRIIAALPVLLTDDAETGRAAAADSLAIYATIPSYQRILERERADSVVDLAAIGTAAAVGKQLQRYRDAGATDLVLSPLRGVDADRRLLWDVAGSLTQRSVSRSV